MDIIASAHSDSELEFLQSRGASEVVLPEMESGMEIARHVLCRLGVPVAEVEEITTNRRRVCPM